MTPQEIHDARLAEVVPTRALPRTAAPSGVYTGAELRTRSSRQGAYDALVLPSRMGSRLRAPGLPPEVAPAPSPAPAPTPRQVYDWAPPPPVPAQLVVVAKVRSDRRSHDEYRPREGSVPALAIAYLQELGAQASLGHGEITARFGLPRKQILGSFGTAIRKGVVVNVRSGAGWVIALPGFVPAPAYEPLPARPAPAPAASRPATGEYRPRAGGTPLKVIEALQREGGHLTYAQICERFDVVRLNLTMIMKPAIVRGALVRHQLRDGQAALSLPGYELEGALLPSNQAQTAQQDSWHAETHELTELGGRVETATAITRIDASLKAMAEAFDMFNAAAQRLQLELRRRLQPT